MDKSIEIEDNKTPLIMRYVNKYYKAPEHIKTKEDFLNYLVKKEREFNEFISIENLKINFGRVNFIEWDGGETIKNKLRMISRTEHYDLYKSYVDLDYIIKYFGFYKQNNPDYFNDDYNYL